MGSCMELEIHRMSMAPLNLPLVGRPAATGRHATCCLEKGAHLHFCWLYWQYLRSKEKNWALRGFCRLARVVPALSTLSPPGRPLAKHWRPHCMRPHCITTCITHPSTVTLLPDYPPITHSHTPPTYTPHTRARLGTPSQYSGLPRVISPGTVVISLSSPRIE